MQYKINAIETKYKGFLFRSRLEAKWAAMFDMLGWNWDYEPTDFSGWIPDFVIYGYKPVYVEVKPVIEFPDDVAEKISNCGCSDSVMIVGQKCLIGNAETSSLEGLSFGWLTETYDKIEKKDISEYLESFLQVPTSTQMEIIDILTYEEVRLLELDIQSKKAHESLSFEVLEKIKTAQIDEIPNMPWWSIATFGRWTKGNGAIGFCHSEGYYVDRISGGYDGGSFGCSIVYAREILALWAKAHNATRWTKKK